MPDNLAVFFMKVDEKTEGLPRVRNILLRGNSGANHYIRRNEQVEHVQREEHVKRRPTQASVRRLLGLFGTKG